MAEQPAKQPPAAKKVQHVMELFADARIDNYYRLRDDNRSNPEVLSYLKEWNAYTDSIMSGTKNFEAELFAEIKGRIKEDDVTAPLRKGPYNYYEKTLLGKEYVQHCRRPRPESQAARPPSVGDVMLNGTSAPPEHAILDENVMAQGHDYFSIDSFKVWLHKLGTKQSSDIFLYHEKDDTFSIDLYALDSKKYLFVGSESKTTRFNFYLDVTKPNNGLVVLTPCVDSIGTYMSHRGNHFFIRRRSDEFFNSEVVASPVGNVSKTTVLIPHREVLENRLKDFRVVKLLIFWILFTHWSPQYWNFLPAF